MPLWYNIRGIRLKYFCHCNYKCIRRRRRLTRIRGYYIHSMPIFCVIGIFYKILTVIDWNIPRNDGWAQKCSLHCSLCKIFFVGCTITCACTFHCIVQIMLYFNYMLHSLFSKYFETFVERIRSTIYNYLRYCGAALVKMIICNTQRKIVLEKRIYTHCLTVHF